jgi:hypothetical protein
MFPACFQSLSLPFLHAGLCQGMLLSVAGLLFLTAPTFEVPSSSTAMAGAQAGASQPLVHTGQLEHALLHLNAFSCLHSEIHMQAAHPGLDPSAGQDCERVASFYVSLP